MPPRLALLMLLPALAGCAPETPPPPPTVTDTTITTDGAYVCVTTSANLTECSPTGNTSPAP